MRTALETLERFVNIERDEARSAQDWGKMDDSARQALIVELAELGERMRARQLAEELYNLDRADAKAYIDELMGRTES